MHSSMTTVSPASLYFPPKYSRNEAMACSELSDISTHFPSARPSALRTIFVAQFLKADLIYSSALAESFFLAI